MERRAALASLVMTFYDLSAADRTTLATSLTGRIRGFFAGGSFSTSLNSDSTSAIRRSRLQSDFYARGGTGLAELTKKLTRSGDMETTDPNELPTLLSDFQRACLTYMSQMDADTAPAIEYYTEPLSAFAADRTFDGRDQIEMNRQELGQFFHALRCSQALDRVKEMITDFETLSLGALDPNADPLDLRSAKTEEERETKKGIYKRRIPRLIGQLEDDYKLDSSQPPQRLDMLRESDWYQFKIRYDEIVNMNEEMKILVRKKKT